MYSWWVVQTVWLGFIRASWKAGFPVCEGFKLFRNWTLVHLACENFLFLISYEPKNFLETLVKGVKRQPNWGGSWSDFSASFLCSVSLLSFPAARLSCHHPCDTALSCSGLGSPTFPLPPAPSSSSLLHLCWGGHGENQLERENSLHWSLHN